MSQQETGQCHGQAEQEHRQTENLYGNTETLEHVYTPEGGLNKPSNLGETII
jgi:hypothetical protein